MHFNAQRLTGLVFAHLVPDYVFQTSGITARKSKSIKGVAIHELIVIVSTAAVLSIYGWGGLLLSIVIAASHFIIDSLKMLTGKYFKRFNTVHFLLDQILHVSFILLCSSFFRGRPLQSFKINFNYFAVLDYFIIITYFSTVFSKTILFDIFNKKLSRIDFFIRGERIFDFMIILLVTMTFLINTFIGVAVLLAAAVVFYLIEAKKFNYSLIQLTVKAVVYLTIAVSSGFLLSGVIIK